MHKKILIYITIIIIIALTAVGSYFLYKKFHPINKPAKEEVVYVYEKEFIKKVEKLIGTKIKMKMSNHLKYFLSSSENLNPSIKDKEDFGNYTVYSIDPENNPDYAADCADYYGFSQCINFVIDNKNSHIILTDFDNDKIGLFGMLWKATDDYLSFIVDMGEGAPCISGNHTSFVHYLLKEKQFLQEKVSSSTSCPEEYSTVVNGYCECIDDKYNFTTSSTYYFDSNDVELNSDGLLVKKFNTLREKNENNKQQ